MDVDLSSNSAVTATTAVADAELVERVLAGDRGLFEVLMRRYNQRLYRAVRAVMRDDSEVEDIMQQAYMNAFAHLDAFEFRSQFSTWLTRIALNEAFARRRKRQMLSSDTAVDDRFDEREPMHRAIAPGPDPERQAYASELQQVLERAVDQLPDSYRLAYMLRDVDGLSTAEAGDALGIREEAVKTRLHRARALIRRAVAAEIGVAAPEIFQFPATRCDRVVAAVLARIG
jgi:RNA polymerase sigma-70 factor (ECF subfamily)